MTSARGSACIEGGEKWTLKYEYSLTEDTASGTYRLKCFPFCQRQHRSGASCSQSILLKLKLSNKSAKVAWPSLPSDLVVWAEIVPEGVKHSAAELAKNAKLWSKDKRHFRGEWRPSSAAGGGGGNVVVMEVNKEKRGWLCKVPKEAEEAPPVFVVKFHVFKKGKSRSQLHHLTTQVSKPFTIRKLRTPSAKAKANAALAKLPAKMSPTGRKRKANDRVGQVVRSLDSKKSSKKTKSPSASSNSAKTTVKVEVKEEGRVKKSAPKVVTNEEVTKGLWNLVLLLQYSCDVWDQRAVFCKDVGGQNVGSGSPSAALMGGGRMPDEELGSRGNLGSIFSEFFEGDEQTESAPLKFNDEDLLLAPVKTGSIFQLFGAFLVEEESVGAEIWRAFLRSKASKNDATWSYDEKKAEFYKALDAALSNYLLKLGMSRTDFDKEVVKQLRSRKKHEPPEEATSNSKKCILTYKQLLRFIDTYVPIQPQAGGEAGIELGARPQPKSKRKANSKDKAKGKGMKSGQEVIHALGQAASVKDEYNLSGVWTVPDEFLDYSDSVRTALGMSKVLVAVMRRAEKTIEIKHREDEVELITQQRLFSNGRQVYSLCGKEFLWTFPAPLPWCHRAAEKYSAWVDKASKALMVKIVYNDDFYSFTMYKRRSETVVDLTAVFYKLNRATRQFGAEMSVGTKLTRAPSTSSTVH